MSHHGGISSTEKDAPGSNLSEKLPYTFLMNAKLNCFKLLGWTATGQLHGLKQGGISCVC